MNRNTHPLTAAIFTLLAATTLTACGSGGGSKGSPDTGTVVTPPVTPPVTPTPDPVIPPPVKPPVTPAPDPYAYGGVADNVLIPTGVKKAQDAGFKGAGVKIGVLDGGLLGAYAPLDGRITEYKDFTGQLADNPLGEKASHGMLVAAFAAGNATSTFKGGVAPEADIYLGRVCAADLCSSNYIAAAVQDFASKGVRIFNMSFGGPANDLTVPGYRATADAVVKAGGLAVVATGNAGRAEPDSPANYPTLAAGYERNWLAVGNVSIGTDGKVSLIDPTSNWCGAAAAFCLVAPGYNRVDGVAGTDSAPFNLMNGTSVSTGIVSGVAAQVWQAYPWMSAANVQQTVLTTATDLGAPGADPVFGWGLVNAEKAVKGPAAFTSSWAAAVTGDSTFSNDISGSGSLTKNGAGRLTLAGNNTYTGSTTVTDGILNLTGSVTSNVLVANSATFEAHGGTINGEYSVVNATGNTAIELGKPLTVTRTAAIKGNLILLPEAIDYKVASSEKILTSGVIDGVKGKFDKVSYANGFFWDAALSYQHNAVIANLTRASAAATAQSIGAPQSVIDGATQADNLINLLDNQVVTGNISAGANVVAAGAALLAADDTTAAASLASLTGQIHGTQRSLAVQTGLNDVTSAADRLPALKSTDGPTFWAQADGTDGDLSRDGYYKASYDTRGATIGVDAPLGASGTIMGASLTSSRTKGNISEAASRLKSDRTAAAAYVYQPLGQSYVSGVISYSQTDVDTNRQIVAGAMREVVATSRDDSALAVRIEAGYNAAGIAPFIAVGALRYHQGAFAERAGLGLGLVAEGDTVTTQFGEVGVRHRFQQGAWAFDSGVAYRSVFGGRNTSFDAAFNGLDATAFTVAGQNVVKDNVRVFFGAHYNVTSSLALYGNLTAERGGSSQSNAAGNLGIRWAF